MRRRLHGYAAAGLLAWAGWCLLTVPAPAAIGPADGWESAYRLAGGFDRAALQKELARPMDVLQKQSAETLRAYVQRLADLQFAMELAVDVSPAERRVLSDQILTRIGQVGFLIRQRVAGRSMPGRAKGSPSREPGLPSADDLVTVVLQNAGLLVRLIGGLLIAYALGSLVTQSRLLRPARPVRGGHSRALSPAPGPWPEPTRGQAAISLAEIRGALAAGHTIMLHLGYEIAPSQRAEFLKLIRKMQKILRGVGGHTYTVWEDRTRRNRFYELLTCREVGVLEHLIAARGPLPRLAKKVEACRVPNGFAFRRVWWEADSEQVARASFQDGVVVSTAL